METPICVLLPKTEDDYTCQLPVLWLLHGLSEDASAWMRNTRVEHYLREYGIAAVMMDAHQSCYEDMAHGGKFFSYITKELPVVMNRFFPFSYERSKNYIAGLSMGGMGAMKIGLYCPEQYSVIGCFSAGYANYRPIIPAKKQFHEKVFDNAYGKMGLDPGERYTEECARKIVEENICIPRIYHTCGKNDFIRKNSLHTRDFFESFQGNPFDYVYEEFPGIHDWAYWDKQIQRFLIYIEKGRGGLKDDRQD